jgi:hypothetical protein
MLFEAEAVVRSSGETELISRLYKPGSFIHWKAENKIYAAVAAAGAAVELNRNSIDAAAI